MGGCRAFLQFRNGSLDLIPSTDAHVEPHVWRFSKPATEVANSRVPEVAKLRRPCPFPCLSRGIADGFTRPIALFCKRDSEDGSRIMEIVRWAGSQGYFGRYRI